MESEKRDLISSLPDPLIGHILSFLATKEAASTSVLSTKWRYLFALVSNLDFDDSVYHLNPIKVNTRKKRVSTSFMDFVDRVLALQGHSPVHKFSLKIQDGKNPVDPNRIFSWILNVLQRSVLDLDLCMDLISDCTFPSEIFMSKTLVRLRLSNYGYGPKIDFEDVYLPKLKSIYMDSAYLEKNGIGLTKLLSGCHVLEDLVLDDISTCLWDFSSVSVTTLKRLRYGWGGRDENPKSVSFDTPNLVYLEYIDTIADKYPKVNFGSLVEAKISLRMSDDQAWDVRLKEEARFSDYAESDEENDMDEDENTVVNATYFIMGLYNVKILYLSANTLEVLTKCCDEFPLFSNLTHLTIESNPQVGWESLPGLLMRSPNLETLVLQGLVHRATFRCGDVCLCKPDDDDDDDEGMEMEIPSCLLSSPVKVLKITKFGEIFNDDIDEQIEQVKHFLETMPNLEQLILYYDASFEEDVMQVSSQLQRLPRVASSKCNVLLISDHLSFSSIVPSSVSMNWASLL